MALKQLMANKEKNKRIIEIIIGDQKDMVIDIRGALPENLSGDKSSLVYVESAEEKRISLQVAEDQPEVSDIRAFQFDTVPLFFEESNYLIEIKSKSLDEITVEHESDEIRNSFSHVMDMNNILIGTINFGGDIGYSEFIINSSGREIARFRIEIFPSKMDYKEDYQAMMDEINNEVYLAVIDFIRRTYHGFDISDSKQSTPAIFFKILTTIFEKFKKSSDRITKLPHHRLETEHPILPYHKIKRTDKYTEKWIIKHPGFVSEKNNCYLVQKAPSVVKQVNYDTQENRFAKYILVNTDKRIKEFQKLYIKSGNPSKQVLDDISSMSKIINHFLNDTFLSDVGRYNHSKSMSLVFEMAPGYRELYKYYIMLKSGLEMQGDVFRIGYKETPTLYEYWCFIKLVRIMRERKYKLISPDPIQVNNSGITVTLTKDKGSEVVYLNRATGEKYTLSYNSSTSGTETQTVAQKPDNILTIEKAGSGFPYKYIFDAKYRLQTDKVNYAWDVPGPKEDDINTMHRYRDAIVYENPEINGFEFRKTMFGAYILFPYPDNEDNFKTHHFYKSIETVNIGALPFLPGKTKLVERFLDELINDTPEKAFAKVTLPIGVERRLEETDWSIKDVMICRIPKEEGYKEYFDNKNCYWIKCSDSYNSDIANAKYIAVYEEGKGIKNYGEIDTANTEIRKGIQIKNESGLYVHVKTDYWYIKIKEWRKKTPAIANRERGQEEPVFSNRFMLANSDSFWQLRLIDNPVKYRLYYQIKSILEGNIAEAECPYDIGDGYKLWVHNGSLYMINKLGQTNEFLTRFKQNDVRACYTACSTALDGYV